MMIAMISPSGREVSPAEQLCRSSRLVPPRFRLVAAEFHPVSLPTFFSRVKAFIQQKMGTGGPPGGPQDRGRAQQEWARPHPCGQGVGPLSYFLCSIIIINSKNRFHGVLGFFGAVQNRFPMFAPFPARIPAVGIPPLSVNIAYYERKGISITPKSIIMRKNIINKSRKT